MSNLPPSTASPIDWPRFVALVRAQRRFLLTSHLRPDCDALGSELGMAGVLEALGKEVLIVNAHPVPPNLRFIDPNEQIKTLGVDVQPGELVDFDAIVVLDTSAWQQLGTMADVMRASPAVRIVLDHHVSQDDLGAEVFKDPQAEAVGRLVIDAATHLQVALTPAIATPLFAAIATDTGWFRFSSVTADTYRYAGQLIAAGASPAAIYNALYEQHSLSKLLLTGRILSRVATELDGRLVHSAALLEDFQATGALLSDTEDVINMTLAVRGTQVAVMLVEQPSGSFKVSFRSRSPQVDCSRVAEEFGGGGHRAAAGASVPGPYEAVKLKVLDAVRRAMT